MNCSFDDLLSVLRSIPGATLWLGLAAVLLPLWVVLLCSRRARGLRAEMLPAVFLLVAAITIALNLSLLVGSGDERTWKEFRPAEGTLFARSLELPLNAYTCGNESLLFLDGYLGGRTLVVSRGGGRRIWDDNGSYLVSAETGKELIFAEIEFADYDDHLSERQVELLLRRRHYGVGIPGRNYAVFVMERRQGSGKVYLFSDGSAFYVLPEALVPEVAGLQIGEGK